MKRFCALTVVALLSASVGVVPAGGKGDKDIRIEGRLTDKDPRDKMRNGPAQTHTVKMKAGTFYTIDMISKDFDAYLRLLDPKGNQIAEDDDSGGDLNSRIEFNCTADGDYRIVTTAFSEKGAGNYLLTVKGKVSTLKVTSSHQQLVDKAAPSFQGDLAINGQAVKLSDLKGKVVLACFWEVRSTPCVDLFPRLRDWYKDHKAGGLEIVGVTFYNFEIGQRIGFDKKTGRLTQLEQADKQTEQQMLRDFAAHHKLDYPLWALPKDEALRAFDAYAVNGLPQLVLIDRKGTVRLIRVSLDDTSAAALEAEMKKLLAEK